MRSLCIMLMLCGISTGAWAQSFSGGSGEDGDPYIISTEDDWNEFLNYNSDGYYFKLGEDILLTTAPTESVTINCDFNNDDNHTISVGTQDTPASVDDFSSITPLFDDSSWESIVTYYFYVTSSTWDDFVSYYNYLSDKSKVYLVLTENVELENEPSNSLSIEDDQFIDNDYKISVSGNWTVFESDEMNTAYVEGGGYEITDNDSWKEFVTAYNNGDITDETPVTINGDIIIDSEEDLPTSSISLNNISSDSFTITVGSDSYEFSLPEEFKPIFSSDLEDNVTYYFSIESDDELSSFINQHEALSKDNVYIKLTSGVAAPDDFEQITEFNGHFDGGSSDYYTITLPNCNINDFTPLFAEGLENVSNVQYICDNITITDADGLNELNEKTAYWTAITQNYTIDTTEDNIELDDNWTPIDDTDNNLTFNYSYKKDEQDKPTSFVIFPSYAVSAFRDNSSYITLKKSETSNIENCFHYSELTISDEEDITYLKDNSSLLAACQKLTLEEDLDYSEKTSSEFGNDVTPLTYSGTVELNDHKIIMPAINLSDGARVLFTGRTDIKYTYPGLSIISEDEFKMFANNQEDYKGVEKVSIDYDGDFYLTDFYKTISEDFNIETNCDIKVGASDNYFDFKDYKPVFASTSLNNAVVYSLEISSQPGMENFCQHANDFDSDDNISIIPNSNKGSDWYDYDMSSTDLTGSDRSIEDLSEEIIILATDKSYGHEPFTNGNNYIQYFYTPSYELVDVLFNNIVTVPENRGIFFTEHTDDSDHAIGKIADFAGHGTVGSPYQIYNYEMLKKLVELINKGLDTEGMFIELASDINAQNNERLTDVDGSIKLAGYNTQTVQINYFKGTFNGKNHSIGGLTRPLFANLDGATIENLGIVDCNMGNSTPALATSASNTTVTKSYVSGVSNSLVSEDGNTVENCYAYNPSLDESNRYTTSSTFDAETVEDISKTHNILKDNCYKLGSKYSDCTLFIPEDNTFYEVSPSNTFFTWNSDFSDSDASTYTYMYYIKWGTSFVWIDNPIKSNVSMLHNVLYRDGWLNNNTDGYAYNNVGSLRSLDYLYSWYIVDKQACNVSALERTEGMCCRVNNIYYGRNSTHTIPKTSAPDGLNTIYLPFAWNPATDVYDSDGNPMGDDVEVYILADKLTSDNKFSDSELYKDYSKEKSLLFFDPANKIDATHTTKYDNFAGVSNALPTLLNIPSGESGWYIKRSGLANYFTPRGEGGSYDKNDADAAGLDNLYNNYWEDQDHADDQKVGRSFMEIDRLGTDWTNWGESSGSYSDYTYTRHYTCESGFSDCDTKKQIYKTDEDKTVGIIDNSSSSGGDYSIYKANEAGDIAVSGGDKSLKIYLPYFHGNEKSLTIYEADDDGNLITNEENQDGIVLHTTDENDKIYPDNEGYPANIYIGSQQIEITSRDDESMIGVVSGSGDLSGKVVIKDESYNYPAELSSFETGGSDWIILDNNGYPNKIIINYSSSPVEIDITRDGSSMTGKVLSRSDGTIKEDDDVIIEDYYTYYPLSIYVCGGHEEETTGSWSGSDFLGRAYHLGTFKTIGNGNSEITFGTGTYDDYSCYKLNSKGDGFAKVTATSTVQPFRTFFAIAPGPDPDAGAGAKALSLGFCGIFDVNDTDDTPTQIDDAPVEGIKLMTPNQSRVYSLDGRYVGQYGQKKLAHGMYIMNGKKFVVK